MHRILFDDEHLVREPCLTMWSLLRSSLGFSFPLSPSPDENMIRNGILGIVNADKEHQQRRTADHEQGKPHLVPKHEI